MNDFGYLWVCKWSKQDYLGNTSRRGSKLYRRVGRIRSLEDSAATTRRLPIGDSAEARMDGSWYIDHTLATSDDCERAFGEAGDLLEPRLSRLHPNIIAALQYNCSYLRMSSKDLVDKVISLPGLV